MKKACVTPFTSLLFLNLVWRDKTTENTQLYSNDRESDQTTDRRANKSGYKHFQYATIDIFLNVEVMFDSENI